jgi:hypothetical protein
MAFILCLLASFLCHASSASLSVTLFCRAHVKTLSGNDWKCQFGCKKLKGDGGTDRALAGHHYRCLLNPSNQSCTCKFCGKQANRSVLEDHTRRCSKDPANQRLVCQFCDAKQLNRAEKKKHEGICKKKHEKDGEEEEDSD